MQSQTQSYAPNHVGIGQPYLQNAVLDPVAPAIAAHPGLAATALTSPTLEELIPPSGAEPRGQIAMVQLAVGAVMPTQSAWCCASSLVTVALSPEASSNTAQILVLEPSNPEDYTALELPVSGQGDYVSSLEWSWPGQRRALLSATASGRVAVWAQPSPQGQDDAVCPRCIDDWHGQLLLEVDSGFSTSGTAGASNSQHTVKQEPGSRTASAAVVHVKAEPGTDVTTSSAAADGVSPGPSGTPSAQEPKQQWMRPSLAAVCWLRQPAGGRVWSTSALALKRLGSRLGEGRGTGGGGSGAQQQQVENFESVFCDEGTVTGAAPHWARPQQLTAAVMTTSGSLIFLWALASKLPNTLAWHRSKALQIPPPEAADGIGEHPAAAGSASDSGAEWRIASGCMCALHDGSLAVAVVYGKRRDVVYLYSMRGNPTLSGQLVPPQPGAAVAAAAVTSATAGREAPLPVVTLTASLAMPPGLSARQCRMHVAGSGSVRRVFVLAQLAATSAQQPQQQQPTVPAWGSPPLHHPNQHQQQTQEPGVDAPAQPPVVVLCFTEMASADGGEGAASWRLERMSAQLEPSGRAAAASDALVSVSPSAVSAPTASPSSPACCSMSLSTEGSKLVVTHVSMVHSLDAETLAVLAAHDLVDPAAEQSADTLLPSPASPLSFPTAAPSRPPRTVLGAAACLSANSCCVCSVARLAAAAPPPSRRQRRRRRSTAAYGDVGLDATMNDVGDTNAAADGGWSTGVEEGDDGDDDGSGGGDGECEGDAVVLSIRTVPDVVPPPGAAAAGGAAAVAALEGVQDAVACNLDTLRLAWGLLHRISLWDVSERLRCTWLAGRQEHVVRCLDQLDGLLYGHEEGGPRTALAPGITRAKLEVLRRLPHPSASLLAGDLLAGARMVQYCQALQLLSGQGAGHQAEALANEETRTVAAHMVWFVLEAHTLMLAGLKLWAEAGPGAGGGTGAGPDAVKREPDGEGRGAGGGEGGGPEELGMLPLIRLAPDYLLYKHAQASLFAPGSSANASKPGSDSRNAAGLGWNPTILELLGGQQEVAVRLRMLTTAFKVLNNNAVKAMAGHIQALQQDQKEGLAPGLPPVPLTHQEMEHAIKTGDMPRALMHGIFPGPFHVHYGRCKGVVTAQLLAQWFRQDELVRVAPYISLSREAILERSRALGLQGQLLDRRAAPHLAARRMWMSFRAPAPAPELHSHVLTQHVSVRQRQRWRRQRAAALALGSAAPLWSHVQGALVDSLTGVPLQPGTPWSLEGASAVGAVTAQMGPGVGAAGSRRNLPPLLSTVQRAWVGAAPPAELGTLWKRARLGLEQDMEY